VLILVLFSVEKRERLAKLDEKPELESVEKEFSFRELEVFRQTNGALEVFRKFYKKRNYKKIEYKKLYSDVEMNEGRAWSKEYFQKEKRKFKYYSELIHEKNSVNHFDIKIIKLNSKLEISPEEFIKLMKKEITPIEEGFVKVDYEMILKTLDESLEQESLRLDKFSVIHDKIEENFMVRVVLMENSIELVISCITNI